MSLCCSDLYRYTSSNEVNELNYDAFVSPDFVQGACTGPWTPSSLWSWLHLDVRRPNEEYMYIYRPVGLAYPSGMRGGCTMQKPSKPWMQYKAFMLSWIVSCDDSKCCLSLWCCYPGSMTGCMIMLGMNDETPLHGCSPIPLFFFSNRQCPELP